MSTQYPKDEFDVAGEDMPVGMHRPQPSRWRHVIPFLLVLVIAPLLGWGASHLLTSRGTAPDQSSAFSSQSGAAKDGQSGAQANASAQEAPSAAPEGGQSDPAAANPDQSASASGGERLDAKVSVLNGTGQDGWAAENSSKLTNAGFTNVSAANADAWEAETSTVYYRDASLEASARKAAEAVGITEVVESSEVGDADIVILLK